MMIVPTVRVCHPDLAGEFMLVNESEAHNYEPWLESELSEDSLGALRRSELESFGWTELKAIATNLGLDKTDGQTWADLIPDILQAEGFEA